MKQGHWIALAAAAILAGGFLAWMLKDNATGDFHQPPEQPTADTDLNRMMDHSLDGHPSVMCQPHEHHAGYTYTPHRYPRMMGGEITAVIHRGFSPMRIPNEADVQWLIAPPSEVMF